MVAEVRDDGYGRMPVLAACPGGQTRLREGHVLWPRQQQQRQQERSSQVDGAVSPGAAKI